MGKSNKKKYIATLLMIFEFTVDSHCCPGVGRGEEGGGGGCLGSVWPGFVSREWNEDSLAGLVGWADVSGLTGCPKIKVEVGCSK